MVNNPNSVPPHGHGPSGAGGPNAPDGVGKTKKPANEFDFGKNHQFLGMNFTQKDWNKLMNGIAQNFCDYVNRRMKEATERMKKGWKKARGEETDD